MGQGKVVVMSYAEQWAALATRIKSLQSAGQLYALFQSYHQEDSYTAGRFLCRQCEAVIQSLQRFRVDFAGSLPSEAVNPIDQFFKTSLAQAPKDNAADQRAARGALVGLAALEAEISFILAGRQEHIRARSELALLHLQRCLAVDEDLATKWQKAFAEGETECEPLGAVHLLLHGIFAFKVNAQGARTDLVFNEPPESSLTRGVEGLVLTEWKIANDTKTATQKSREARVQADLYSQGALAGIELRDFRYLIVVSLKELTETVDGVVYRHVNIAVQPEVPSKTALKMAGTGRKRDAA